MTNSDKKTGKPLAQTFITQLWNKFNLAWDDANQFRDCPGHTLGCMTHTAPSDSKTLGAGYKYSYLLTLPRLDKIFQKVLEQ